MGRFHVTYERYVTDCRFPSELGGRHTAEVFQGGLSWGLMMVTMAIGFALEVGDETEREVPAELQGVRIRRSDRGRAAGMMLSCQRRWIDAAHAWVRVRAPQLGEGLHAQAVVVLDHTLPERWVGDEPAATYALAVPEAERMTYMQLVALSFAPLTDALARIGARDEVSEALRRLG
jgi:hypothetical protein